MLSGEQMWEVRRLLGRFSSLRNEAAFVSSLPDLQIAALGGRYLIDAGDLDAGEAAYQRLRAAGNGVFRRGLTEPAVVRDLATMAHRFADAEMAGALLVRLASSAGHFANTTVVRPCGAHYLAGLTAVLGRSSESDHWYAQALATHSSQHAPLLAAETLIEWGRSELRYGANGHVDRARIHLRDAWTCSKEPMLRGCNPWRPNSCTKWVQVATDAMIPPFRIDHDAVARAVAIGEPRLRNHEVTLGYWELARRLEDHLGAEHANWCTWATWASRTVGHALDPHEDPHLVIERTRDKPAVLRWLSIRAARLSRRTLNPRMAPAIAEGNREIYDEIADDFVDFLDQLDNDKFASRDDAIAWTGAVRGARRDSWPCDCGTLPELPRGILGVLRRRG